MATPKKTEMKRLSQVQYFHLVNWLMKEVPNCAPGTTHATIADRASQALQCSVSAFSVGDAMRSHNLKIPGPKITTTEERIQVLAETVAILWKATYPVNDMPADLKELLK